MRIELSPTTETYMAIKPKNVRNVFSGMKIQDVQEIEKKPRKTYKYGKC